MTTTLCQELYTIPSADLGQDNPLPVFRSAVQDITVNTDATVPAEDRTRLGWQTGPRVLPYRMQDGYNRTLHPRSFHSVALENELVKAIFLPEVGGRLVSLFHKPTGRELLDRNPVFQPANLAIRNAWFSGGIEWNAGHFGHHCFTCAPVFAAQVQAPSGYPVLRIYEWDRMRCFPWQVDFHLPPGSPMLYARMRLVNPHDHEISMYWWTNIAVPENEGTRLIVPATHSLRDVPLTLAPLPYYKNEDYTYPTKLGFAQEFFFHLPKHRRPWFAAIDAQGHGFVETSTRRLRGRKMFVWGMNEGGRNWQQYLAQPGRAYFEIQAGLARTQLESVPMPAGDQWTWTEAFGYLKVDPDQAHSKHWDQATHAVEQSLEAMLTEAQLDALDNTFDTITRQAPTHLLALGSGWGALERHRLAHHNEPDLIPPELIFPDDTLHAEQAPWLELLQQGTLPLMDANLVPNTWMVQPDWKKPLEETIHSGRSDHWLSWLHLGNIQMEAGDTQAATHAWKQSIQHQPTAWAWRNLAITEQRDGHMDTACDLWQQAWTAGPISAALAIEYTDALNQCERYDQLNDFIASLPDAIRSHERIHLLAAKVALKHGQLEVANQFFAREFITIREGETALTDLWFEAQAHRMAIKENVPLDDALRQRSKRELRPPTQLDFRMR